MNKIEIPPSQECLVYPTYGPRTITNDSICGLEFTVSAECVSVDQSGGNIGSEGSGGSGGDYIIITVNITKKDIYEIPSYMIVQVELIDPKGSVIKQFGNDAIMTDDMISFNIPRPPCPSNPNIFLEIGNIAVRLLLPCDGDISGSCDSGSGSESSPESAPIGSSSGGGSGPAGYDILFDKKSWADIVPEPTKTYLNSAADVWRGIATINTSVTDFMRSGNPDWNGITLQEYIPYNDPSSNVVAYCILTSSVAIEGIAFNAVSFNLGINFAWGMSAAYWTTVMIHELGHALGIGFWNMSPSNWLDGLVYTDTLDGYKTHINSNLDRRYIPVEDTGNIGTIGVHWEDNSRSPPTYSTPDDFAYPGIDDIMVGTISSSKYTISSVSRNYLKDLKYSITSNNALLSMPPLTLTNNESLLLSNPWCGCLDHCKHHTVNILANLSELN